MMSGIAILEEFLQQKYVENYDYEVESSTDSKLSKIDILRARYPDYFFQPIAETRIPYILYKGNKYFLIQKQNLPQEIREALIGGDAGKKTYQDYASFNDVYGITSDLKIYYCQNGLESRIGAADELLKDDLTRVAISNESSMADFLKDNFSWVVTNMDGDVLSENLESLKNLDISNAEIDDLVDLYNFSSLETLTITDATIGSLEGIELSTLLTKIQVTNSAIEDWKGIEGARYLKSILISNSPDSEVATKLGNALHESTITSLEYLSIIDSPNISSIDGINNISDATKGEIKYLYLNDNGYTSVELANGFNKLYELEIEAKAGISGGTGNKTLKSIKLSNMPELVYLRIRSLMVLESLTNLVAPKLDYCNANGDNLLNNVSCLINSPELRYPYFSGTGLTNADFLVNNTKCGDVDFRSCPNFENIDGLKGRTSIWWLGITGSKLGKDKDIQYTNGNYFALPKSDDNVLNALNNLNIATLYLSDNKYLGYIESIATMPNLKYLYLDGCDNILTSQFALENIKNKINSLTGKQLPSGKEIAFLSNTETTLILAANNKLSLDDFQTIGNYTNLKNIRLGTGAQILKNGVELTEAEYNEEVNVMLNKLPNLVNVAIYYSKLSDISFVKNENHTKIRGLDLRYTKVGTHLLDENEDEILNNNGLVLLNTYLPDLNYLCANYVHTDLSFIQPAISKMDDWESIPGAQFSYQKGLVYVGNQSILNTLSKCTDITHFLCGDPDSYSYDLSKCSALEMVRFDYFGENVGCTVKLPTTSTRVDKDGTVLGYTVDLREIDKSCVVTGGGGCSSLTLRYPSARYAGRVLDNEAYWEKFEGFRNSLILKEVTLRNDDGSANASQAEKVISSSGFEVFSGCTNIEKFTYCGMNSDTSLITDISFLENLTNLKEIYFSKTKITSIPDFSEHESLTSITIIDSNVVDMVGLSECNSVETLNLNNNSINDLSPIKNLTNITSLDLGNNTIKGKITTAQGKIDNIATLNLFQNRVTYIDVRNNKLTEDDKAKISWITNK